MRGGLLGDAVELLGCGAGHGNRRADAHGDPSAAGHDAVKRQGIARADEGDRHEGRVRPRGQQGGASVERTQRAVGADTAFREHNQQAVLIESRERAREGPPVDARAPERDRERTVRAHHHADARHAPQFRHGEYRGLPRHDQREDDRVEPAHVIGDDHRASPRDALESVRGHTEQRPGEGAHGRANDAESEVVQGGCPPCRAGGYALAPCASCIHRIRR